MGTVNNTKICKYNHDRFMLFKSVDIFSQIVSNKDPLGSTGNNSKEDPNYHEKHTDLEGQEGYGIPKTCRPKPVPKEQLPVRDGQGVNVHGRVESHVQTQHQISIEESD